MYFKLVYKNAKQSVKDYLIYIVTMTVCVTMFYAFLSISSKYYHPEIGAEFDITILAGGMKLAICAVSLLLLFLIHYVNRFMLQKRQKEFAVEATIGMEPKTIGRLFFAETFFLSMISLGGGILLGMLASQFITAMLQASFGKSYSFAWMLFPDTVLLTVGFFVLCQILVGAGNVRTLNKSKIIHLMTADRQNEKPLQKSHWMSVICIFYSMLLLWMLETGIVQYHFYFDNRHPFPVKLMYQGNILFPAFSLLWAAAAFILHRKIRVSLRVSGLLIGVVCCMVSAFSIPIMKKNYFLGVDTPTLNKYLLFMIFDILFIISAVIYLFNMALTHWKESKAEHKYKNTNLFLFGQILSKMSVNTKTMTIICATLAFSICLFVIAPILTGWSLGYLDSRSMYDIQISSSYNEVYETERLPDTDYLEITDFLTKKGIETDGDLTFSEYLPKKEQFSHRIKYEFPSLAIALRDYNAVREMLGYQPVHLGKDEFTTHWYLLTEKQEIEEYITQHPVLETDAGELKLSEYAAHQEPLGESIYNLYSYVVYIIPDEAAEKLLAVQENRFVMTSAPLPYRTAAELERLLEKAYPDEPEGDNSPSYNVTVHTTEVNRIIASNFVLKASLIYGAVVLAVMCLTVLALQQLLDAGKYKYRFSVLRNLGVEEKEIQRLILKQLGIWFGFPIMTAIGVAAIIIIYFVHMAAAEITAYMGLGVLFRQTGMIVGILAALLLCYFISTWILFCRTIKQA